MYDIAIIGAGVIGTAIARELSRYDLGIVVLERGNDVALGATKANSAIVHAGYDADYRSAMGPLNVAGNRKYETVCDELAVPFKRTGSLVCAFEASETAHLEALLENGRKLGVPGLRIIGRDTALRLEPNLQKTITAALYAPTAGITVPWELAIAYAENAVDNGAELRLNFAVKSITKNGSIFLISSGADAVEATCVVNCAGAHADEVARMVMAETGFSIMPRRGQYYLLDKTCEGIVNTVLFPAPSKLGKGTLVAPTIDGNVVIGPDAEDLGEDDRDAVGTTAAGLANVRRMADRLVEGLPYNGTITTFSGIRAEPSTGDFIIGESSVPGFVNVAGIKSPGLSSAPAIAERVVELIRDRKSELCPRSRFEAKAEFKARRRPRPVFAHLDDGGKAELIKRDPRFGNVICRCETVTEGEIVDAIHRNAGGRTLNGIKRRVRPGAGRCQGGFCGPRVVAILARELKQDPTDIRLEGVDSIVLTGLSGQEVRA